MTGSRAKDLLAGIRLAVFDVDGVFTDGRFYLSDAGVESKAFHTQDGHGIKELLRAGIAVAVISARNSEAVRLRMAELGVPYVRQGAADKLQAFESLLAELQLQPAQCVYTGDDVPDLPLLQAAGFAVAAANAVDVVKAAADYVTQAPGGAGAVREVCELVLRSTAR